MAAAKGKKNIRIDKARHMVVTPVGRVSFPQLHTARAFEDDPDGKKIFRLDLIFPSSDVLKQPYEGKKLQTVSLARAIQNAKIDMWGDDKAKWPKFRFPNIRDGNERKNEAGDVYEGYADAVFIQAKTGEKFPPKVVGKNGKPLTEDEVYGGCYGRAQIICSPYSQGVNHGVSLQLISFLKEKDGERFGGFPDAFDFEDDDEGEDDWGSDEADDDDF